MQVYHGTQYIDEIVAVRLQHGRAYVHQDANWNVIALTDLKGATLERYYYSCQGQAEVTAETHFGHHNGNGFVDATNAPYLTTNGRYWGTASGKCRVFDLATSVKK